MPPTTTRTLNPVPFEHWEPKRFGRGAAALLRVPALVAACKATGPDPNSRVTSRHLRRSERRLRPNCSLQWKTGGGGGRLSPGFGRARPVELLKTVISGSSTHG